MIISDLERKQIRQFHSILASVVDDHKEETVYTHHENVYVHFLQGNLDQFDYPKKGKNIPPSKHDAPPKEIPEQKDHEEDGEQPASYYDENGEAHEGEDGYGNEDGYGQEAEYGDEMVGQDNMQQDLNQNEYDQEGVEDYG